MLNDKNLCDLYIAAGEASLSEVCTDFPRFGIEYRNVEQKCLSLACEEVCRIFFSKTKPVKFVEQELFGDSDDDQGVTEEEAAFFEEVQRELIAILQDRTKPIGVRVDEYLDRANEYQKKLSQNDVEKHIDWLSFNDFHLSILISASVLSMRWNYCARCGRISRMICRQSSQRLIMKTHEGVHD